MPKKLKFKPSITRVKLNPEQAVLICSCYSAGMLRGAPLMYAGNVIGPIHCLGGYKAADQGGKSCVKTVPDGYFMAYNGPPTAASS